MLEFPVRPLDEEECDPSVYQLHLIFHQPGTGRVTAFTWG